jgi:hypothetical protein
MARFVRWWAVGGVTSALVAWSLILVANGTAADEDKEARDAILKLADVMAKGDQDAATKQAQAIAKKIDEVSTVMDLMKPRGDGGLGVGTPGQFKHDGIEKELLELGKQKAPMTPAQMKEQGDALGRLGDHVAAIATVAKFKCPVQSKMGQKDPKDWKMWCDEMRQAALEFANAAKAKDAGKLKTVTLKLNSTCSSCHSVFRD